MNEFERQLIGSRSLPTLPAVAQRILEVCSRDESDLIDLSNTISYDPAIATRVLRLINSPAYGLCREVVSMREAVLYLGFNAVRSVALSFSFIHSFKGPDGPSAQGFNELWRTSLASGLAARRLAQELGGWDGEEAFLSGLIADCGTLLMYKKVPEYPSLVARFRQGEADLLELERANLPTDHMKIGAHLLERWSFPAHFWTVIGAHHDARRLAADSSLELRVRVLNSAWLCARAVTVPGFGGDILRLDHRVARLLGLPVTVVRAIASELPDEILEVANVFDIPAGQQLSFEELIEQANENLSEIALDAERALSRVESEQSDYDRVLFTNLRAELASSLSTDGQSGLLSSESFETVLDAFHNRAREARSALGVMIIEVDNLKELGAESLGEALGQIRERIEDQTRPSDVSARVSDHQVVVLMPGCSTLDLEHVAERVRVALEGRPLALDGTEIACPVSIGMVATNPHVDSVDVGAFLRLAWSALDRAHGTPERIAVER
jgi:diguanylate cyclase (GGDEF)-like protein